MSRHSGIKVSTLFVFFATLASANPHGIWDGYALPHGQVQPAAGQAPGSYKAWLNNVRPQRRDPSAYVHLGNHQMRNALAGGQEEYTDASDEPNTTEASPPYEAVPPHPTPNYNVCPPPVEPTTVTSTVTYTITEPPPPPVTVTSVCTVTETVTTEVEPTSQVYSNSYNVVASTYTTTTYYLPPPVITPPVKTTPINTPPAYSASTAITTGPVYTAPVFPVPVYTSPIYAVPPPPPPVTSTPAPGYNAPAPTSTSTGNSYDSSAPAYPPVAQTYASLSELTTVITVTHTSVSTATYTSIYDSVSEITVTETVYPVTKKSTKPKKGRKGVHSEQNKTAIPGNPWIRVAPTPSPSRHLADGDQGDEIVHHGQARKAAEAGDIVYPEYAGDIGFRLKHENARRNA
ncbi:hypothetical protein IWW37_005665 [Coemansia sp. RSA 2050]|nr:hypothetical protein IWW37_005665 [Coemansia sp. RSA 2050]KAJ2729708.1 hypothetical protein IW152_005519 [Coemansia sp. BCRC 34962]